MRPDSPAAPEAPADPTADLLPCPFCGGAAKHGIGTCGPARGGHYVECVKCGASTNIRSSSKEDAIPLLREQWNSRVGKPRVDPNAKRLRDALSNLVNAIEGGRPGKIGTAAQNAEDLLCKLEGVADD